MTIISFKRQFIFIKPKKVAGTSLEIALSRFCGKDDIMSMYKEKESNRLRARYYPYPVRSRIGAVPKGATCAPKLAAHRHAPELRALLGDDVFRRFLKISVTRNPYDWIISLYAWLAHRGMFGLSQTMGVSRFREWFMGDRSDEILCRSWRRLASLGRPYDAVDFMIRFEHFEEDLTALSHRLGLTENIYDTFKGIRDKGAIRPQSLTTRACFEGFTEGIEKVKEYYAIELERFGYDLPWLSGGLPGGLSGLSVPTETPQEMKRESV